MTARPGRGADPNKLVAVHGIGRIPDGHIVPHRLPDDDHVPQSPQHALEHRAQLPTRTPAPLEPREVDPPPVSVAERWWALLFAAIVLAAIVIGSLR